MAEQMIMSTATRARSGLVWALLGDIALLAVSGVALVWRYRPSLDVFGVDGQPGTRGADVVRAAHRGLAWAAVALALALAITAVIEAVQRWDGPGRRRVGLVIGPAAVIVVIGALLTGFLLPWDQLAMRAVTVGGDIRGYGPILFGDDVRFVLIGGSEVSVATVRTVLFVHVALTGVAAALLVAYRRRGDDGADRQDVGIAASDGWPQTG